MIYPKNEWIGSSKFNGRVILRTLEDLKFLIASNDLPPVKILKKKNIVWKK